MNNTSNAGVMYDVVICGAGPIGLIAAFELLRKGNKVLIVEKRSKEESTSRQQMIVLDEPTKIQLINFIHDGDKLDDNDFKFLENLGSSKLVKVSSIQRFLLNRIHNLNNQISNSSTPQALIEYKTMIKSASLPEGTATLISNEQEIDILFGHMVAADGANCESLQKVDFGVMKKPVREAVSKLKYLNDTYHLGVSATCKRIDGLPFKIPDEEFIKGHSPDNLLYFLRVDQSSHKKSWGTSVKIGFIGEIPKKIFRRHQEENPRFREDGTNNSNSDPKHATALNYVKTILAKKLKIHKSDISFELRLSKNTKKNATRVLAFKGRSIKADTAAVRANTHAFYLLGDAYFSPNYPLGHGLNDGACAAGYLRHTGKSTQKHVDYIDKHIAHYNKLTNDQAKSAINIMRRLYWIDTFKQKWYIRRLLMPKFDLKVGGSYIMLRDQYDNAVNREQPAGLDYNTIDLQILDYINDKFTRYIASSQNESEDLMIEFMRLNSIVTTQYRIEIRNLINKLQEKNPDINLKRASDHIERIVALTRQYILEKAGEVEKNTDELFESTACSDPDTLKELFKMKVNPFQQNEDSLINKIKNRKSIYIILAIEYLMTILDADLFKINAKPGLINELVTVIREATNESRSFKLYKYIFDIDYLNQILKKLNPDHHALSNWDLAFRSLGKHISQFNMLNQPDEDMAKNISSSDTFRYYGDYYDAAKSGNINKLKEIESILSDPRIIESYLQKRESFIYKLAIQNGHFNIIKHLYDRSPERFKKTIQSNNYSILNYVFYSKSNEVINFIFNHSVDEPPNELLKKNSYKLFLSSVEQNNDDLFVYLSQFVDSFDITQMLTEHRLLHSAVRSQDDRTMSFIVSMVKNSATNHDLSEILNEQLLLSTRSILVYPRAEFSIKIATLVHLFKLLNIKSTNSPNFNKLLSFSDTTFMSPNEYENRVHFIVSAISGIEEVTKFLAGKDQKELKTYFKYAICGGFDYLIEYFIQHQLLDIVSAITKSEFKFLTLAIANKQLETLKILLNLIPDKISTFIEAKDYLAIRVASDIVNKDIYHFLLKAANEHHVSIDAIIEANDYRIIDTLIYNKNISELNDLSSMSTRKYNKSLIQNKLIDRNLDLLLVDPSQDIDKDIQHKDIAKETSNPFDVFMKHINDCDIDSLYHFLDRDEQTPFTIIRLLEFNDYEGFKTALSKREPDLILLLFKKAVTYNIVTPMMISIIDQYIETNSRHMIEDIFVLEPIQEWARLNSELVKEHLTNGVSSHTRYSFFIKLDGEQNKGNGSPEITQEVASKPNR